MEPRITLSELNERIKKALQETLPATLWIVAEISEINENRSGHCYIELIEKSENEIVARTRATIWSYTYRILKPYFETSTGQVFREGIKILVQVSVEFHAAFGLSLNIRDIDPVYTIGDLALQRKQILERLEMEGVLNMNKELPLPLVPQKIAIISSKTAAGYEDFVNQLTSNSRGFQFYHKLFQAWMQGADAVPSIISALEKIYLYEDFFDVVVIIRGGGATADLNCFDNYDLALNITQFPLPVITGIGHEKDETIADKVAHTRLKTPTAVAEFLINGTERFYENLSTLQDELVRQTEELIEFQGSKLEGVSNLFSELTLEYIRDKSSVLIKHGNRLNKSTVEYTFRRNYEMVGYHHKVNTVCAIHRIENQKKFEALGKLHETLVRDKISAENKNLTMIQNQIIKDVSGQLKKLNGFIQNSENMLNALSPGNVLKRGYSLTFKNGKLLKSVKSLTVADEIETWFSIGSAKSIITEKQVNHE